MAIFGFARAALLSSAILAGIGCASALQSPAREAAVHLDMCLGGGTGSGGTAYPEDEVGSGRGPCVDHCIQAATCDELVDAFSGQPTMTSSAFIGCTTACADQR